MRTIRKTKTEIAPDSETTLKEMGRSKAGSKAKKGLVTIGTIAAIVALSRTIMKHRTR